MAKGGKRHGAGRPPGAIAKASAAAREAVLSSGDETPLDYMLRVMRDRQAEHSRRDDMAKAAAGYVHSKLSSVDANVKANVDGTVTFTWLPPQ